jgi:hypothetical protein
MQARQISFAEHDAFRRSERADLTPAARPVPDRPVDPSLKRGGCSARLRMTEMSVADILHVLSVRGGASLGS